MTSRVAIPRQMTSDSVALPVTRRRRRPPKALISLACANCVALGWILDCVLGIATGKSSPVGDGVFAIMALVWSRRSLVLHHGLREALRAVDEDRALGSPRIGESLWLAFSALVMVYVAVLIATGH